MKSELFTGGLRREHSWSTWDATTSSTGVAQLIWASLVLESLGMETGVLRPARPGLQAVFSPLSRQRAVAAKRFLTLPLACSPPQHRGKHHACTFHERSRNGCVFTSGMGLGGLTTPPFTLRFFCWLWHFLFGCVSFPALPFC